MVDQALEEAVAEIFVEAVIVRARGIAPAAVGLPLVCGRVCGLRRTKSGSFGHHR
jgi:hypothetical protein